MNVEMNILKALAIIAMVIGHSRGLLVGNVYLYHMALFVFISGYFYKEVYSENPEQLIIKRFKSLYIPFLKFNFFILIAKIVILDNLLLGYGNGPMVDFESGLNAIITFNSVDPLISAFWFLKNLLYINIIFSLISYMAIKLSIKFKRFSINLWRFMLVITSFLLFFYLTDKGFFKEGEISYISRAFILNIFFYFGFIYKVNEIKFKSIFKPTLLIISIIYIMVAPKYDYFDTYYFYFVNIPFFLISSVIGIYANIYLSKILVKSNIIKKLLNYIGENSLWILTYHLIMFKVAIFIKIKLWSLDLNVIWEFPTYVNGRWDWLLDCLLGVMLPIILCYLTKKIVLIIKKYLIKGEKVSI